LFIKENSMKKVFVSAAVAAAFYASSAFAIDSTG
jgi:hypothetical protein